MTDRDRLIEITEKSFAGQYEKRGLLTAPHTVDDLLANGVIVPPCKVGDMVWISRICGLKEDNSPIFKMEQGQVYQMRIDNGKHTKLWIDANFGVFHCCRPYTDFCYTKEEAEAKLKELNKDA